MTGSSGKSSGQPACPVSTRLSDALCVAFAIWTLCCHAVVLAGGSLGWVIGLFLVLASGGGALAWLSRRQGRPFLPEAPLPITHDARDDTRPTPLRLLPGAGVALGIAGALLIARTGSPLALWWVALALLLAAGTAFLLLEAPRVEAPRAGLRLELGLFSLGLVCAVYTLVAHRPDADDAFYVNLAVGALDRPDLPLLAIDTIHGRDDLPIHYPSYRLHSLEIAAAALARFTGLEPIQVLHYGLASLAALFVPLCHAVLFRLLTPRVWLWSVGALVLVLVCAGETHRWYGNFAFVRLWQGKGIFLFVFMPLVYAYAIRFALAPSWRGGLLLAAAQIAAVGCSSSAVWAAPAGALMALCSVLRPNLVDLRRFGLGALASLYVLVIGVFLKQGMAGHTPTLKRRYEAGDLLGDAFARTLGDAELQILGIAAFISAWAWCRRGLGQRFAVAIPLAVAVVLLNPYADAWVRANVTGPSYWRVMWALPVPLLIALCLVAPLQWNGLPWRRAAGRLVSVALCAAFAIAVPTFPGWSRLNGVEIARPHLKVDAAAYRWAAKLNAVAPGQRVVAPPAISTWVPTFRHHAYPLMVRGYLRANRKYVGEHAFRERLVMTRFVAGEKLGPEAPEVFERGLELWDVKAVCLRNSDLAGTARQILRRQGFARTVQGLGVEIWVRS